MPTDPVEVHVNATSSTWDEAIDSCLDRLRALWEAQHPDGVDGKNWDEWQQWHEQQEKPGSANEFGG